jgi:hypothetical protein
MIGGSLCENENINQPSPVRNLKQVTIHDVIIRSTIMNGHWKEGYSYHFMIVQWKEGLHSFVKKCDAIIGDSLCEN